MEWEVTFLAKRTWTGKARDGAGEENTAIWLRQEFLPGSEGERQVFPSVSFSLWSKFRQHLDRSPEECAGRTRLKHGIRAHLAGSVSTAFMTSTLPGPDLQGHQIKGKINPKDTCLELDEWGQAYLVGCLLASRFRQIQSLNTPFNLITHFASFFHHWWKLSIVIS